MINDSDYYKNKNIIDIITQKQLLENHSMDFQGLSWTNRNRSHQLKQFLIQIQPFFNVLKEKQPQPFEANIKTFGMLKFQYAIQQHNINCYHFQLHNCLKEMNNTNILYTSKNGISVFNDVTKQRKQLFSVDYPVQVDYSKKYNLIAGPYDKDKAFIYDLNKQKFLYQDQVFQNQIQNIDQPEKDVILLNELNFISDNKDDLAMVGNSKDVLVKDLHTLKNKITYKALENVNKIDYSDDLNLFGLAMDHQDIQLIDYRDPKSQIILQGHQDFNFSLCFMEGKYIATGGQDVTARIWDIRKPSIPYSILEGIKQSISSIKYVKSKKLLLFSENFCHFHIYNLQNQAHLYQTLDFFSEIAGFAVTPNGKNIFIGHDKITRQITKFTVKQLLQKIYFYQQINQKEIQKIKNTKITSIYLYQIIYLFFIFQDSHNILLLVQVYQINITYFLLYIIIQMHPLLRYQRSNQNHLLLQKVDSINQYQN